MPNCRMTALCSENIVIMDIQSSNFIILHLIICYKLQANEEALSLSPERPLSPSYIGTYDSVFTFFHRYGTVRLRYTLIPLCFGFRFQPAVVNSRTSAISGDLLSNIYTRANRYNGNTRIKCVFIYNPC